MKAADNPEYLRATAEAVAEFRDALNAFLELHEVNDWLARGVAPAVLPKSDADPERLQELRAKVSRAAGRASAAASLTGVHIIVQGAGRLDPITTWETITMPKPVLEASNVLDASEQMLGRLEALMAEAEAEASPTIGAEAMHPLVWTAARRLWRDQHYRAAVAAAAETLVATVKSSTGRHDVAETALWQQTFSEKPPVPSKPGQPGQPRLRWPGDPGDRDVKTMNDGLRQFAPGVQMTIRNPAAHNLDELTEQEALELPALNTALSPQVDLRAAVALQANQRPKRVHQGKTLGVTTGFEVDEATAARLRAAEAGSAAVVHPFLGGQQLLHELHVTRAVIDIPTTDADVAWREAPTVMRHLEQHVLPVRQQAAVKEAEQNQDRLRANPHARVDLARQKSLDTWWVHWRRRGDLFDALTALDRYIAVPRVSTQQRMTVFAFVDAAVHLGDSAVAFTLDDDYSLGVLQSATHPRRPGSGRSRRRYRWSSR